MRSDFVVVYPPVLDDITGMFQADKPIGVQTLIAQSPDETLGKGILDWLATTKVQPETPDFALDSGWTSWTRQVIGRYLKLC